MKTKKSADFQICISVPLIKRKAFTKKQGFLEKKDPSIKTMNSTKRNGSNWKE